jgi:hypothetical protein
LSMGAMLCRGAADANGGAAFFPGQS